MKDVQKLLRPVYYFNNGLYYQVDSCSKIKLIKKNNELKKFIVLDITENKLYNSVDFILTFGLEFTSSKHVVEFLDTLRFKVYRKIKVKEQK